MQTTNLGPKSFLRNFSGSATASFFGQLTSYDPGDRTNKSHFVKFQGPEYAVDALEYDLEKNKGTITPDFVKRSRSFPALHAFAEKHEGARFRYNKGRYLRPASS